MVKGGDMPSNIKGSSNSTEWFTPYRYALLARKFLRGIDLDPASCMEANRIIKAKSFYTKEDNGLALDWIARTIFCNPPYGKINGKSSQGIWATRMINQHLANNFEEGLLLINSYLGYQWYENLYINYPVCFVREKMKFLTYSDNEYWETGEAKVGQSFIYVGNRKLQFRELFNTIGRVILP